MAKPIIHTKYRLELGNPFRGYGLARLVLGIVLILMALKAFQSLGLPAKGSGLAGDIAAMAGQAEGRISYGIHAILTFIFACVALVSGIAHALAGAEHTARLYLPAKVPDDFRDANLLSKSMREREILTYRSAPSNALRVLRAFFAEGVEFLPPSFRPTVSENIGYVPLAVIPILLVLVIISARGTLGQLLAAPIGRIPFPTAWLLVVLVIGAFRLATAILLVPRQVPSAEFERANQTLGGAGHPETFLAELELKSDEFRYMDIPNRIHRRHEVELVSDGATDSSGKIRGGILMETQPIPEKQTHRLPGYLFLAGGCVCVPLGLYLLCFLPFDLRTSRLDEFILQRSPVLFLEIILGWVVLRNGQRFFREAKTVLGRMLFSSDVFDIEFSGTFYRGEIGAGMAHDDSLRSTSTTIRSEVIIRYFAATCLTESVEFGKRELLETTVPEPLRERLRVLINTLEQHQDRGAKLVGIDLEGGKAVEQIAGANVQLHAAKEAAATQAKRSSAPPPPVLKEEPKLLTSDSVADSADMKECPDCAEMVRAKAKKCRFCGHQFEES